MTIAIDPYVAQLAEQESQATGLLQDVILAHWNQEEGVESPNWPNNNPAGITPGNPQVDALSTGTNNGFDVFPTPAAGAQAYGILINTDSNYAGIRAVANTGSAYAQLNAIAQSPWDAGHYGGNGYKLFASYTAVTGVSVGTVVDPYGPQGTAYAPASLDQSGINNQVQFPATNYSVVANSQRQGNVLYGRRYRIVVSNSLGVALDVSDLHCTFNIQVVVNQQPPFSTIVIYNLNPITENVILNYGDRITVEAGYEGEQYGLIFDGDVIEPIRDKEDNVTYRLTIYALASDRALNQAFAAFTLNRGQSARSLVQNLASKATVPTPLGFLSPSLSDAPLPRGQTVFGLTRDYLRAIAQADGMAYYMHDGKITLLHAKDPPSGDIVSLTPQSGLIGQPAQSGLGVSFQCLLNPSLTINRLVSIASDLVQAQAFQIGEKPRPLDAEGIYRIVGVTYVGDTRGTEWYSECVTVSQLGGIPGMISATTQIPWGN